jgi:5-deoxy-D-glucuronate isomerase
LHFLHTTPAHWESAKSLSTDTHTQQQTIYKTIGVMAVPLVATIAFLIQAQTAEKVTVTSPCSKAQKKSKTLTTSCNPQDMRLGHRATRYPSVTVRHNREVGKHDGRLEGP